MLRGQRHEGAAIGEAMAPMFAKGTLARSPIASHRLVDVGFTVGKAAFTSSAGVVEWRSTYVTIWRRQPDGSWKVLFDTGRVVQQR